jgi:hypothetical protein
MVNLTPLIVCLWKDGDVSAQEDMLRKQSSNAVSAVASRNIFQLVWGKWSLTWVSYHQNKKPYGMNKINLLHLLPHILLFFPRNVIKWHKCVFIFFLSRYMYCALHLKLEHHSAKFMVVIISYPMFRFLSLWSWTCDKASTTIDFIRKSMNLCDLFHVMSNSISSKLHEKILKVLNAKWSPFAWSTLPTCSGSAWAT